jgi:hypothetical protein
MSGFIEAAGPHLVPFLLAAFAAELHPFTRHEP